MSTSPTTRKRTTAAAGCAVTLVVLAFGGRSASADDGEPAVPQPTVTMVLEPPETIVLELEPPETIVLELEPPETIVLEIEPPPTLVVDDIFAMPLPGDDDVLEIVPLFPQDTEPEDSEPGDGPLQTIPGDPIVPFVPLDVPDFPEGDDATTTTSSTTTTTTSSTTSSTTTTTTAPTVETVEPTVPAATTDPLAPSTPPANQVGRLPTTGGSPTMTVVIAGALLAVGAAISILLHRTKHDDR